MPAIAKRMDPFEDYPGNQLCTHIFGAGFKAREIICLDFRFSKGVVRRL